MAKTYKDKANFNGDWTIGEASHHIGKKTTTKTHRSHRDYNRKDKSWKRDLTIS